MTSKGRVATHHDAYCDECADLVVSTERDVLREFAEWHERKADQADSVTQRTLHLVIADAARQFQPTDERGRA